MSREHPVQRGSDRRGQPAVAAPNALVLAHDRPARSTNRHALMRKTESNRWAEAFADEWLTLIAGQANFLDLLDWAHELYPQDHRLDPATVARREFDVLTQS